MHSELKVLDAICFWCGQPKECVEVEVEKGHSVDLCWSCLRTKANAGSGRAKGKSKNGTAKKNGQASEGTLAAK